MSEIDIDVACRAVLAADSGVIAIVTANRIYPDNLPSSPTLPAITYSLISDVPNEWVKGDAIARVQISCWDKPTVSNGVRSPAVITSLKNAVKDALSRSILQKQIRAFSVGGTTFTVLSCKCSNSPRLFENDTGYYHVPCDFMIKFRK